MTRQLIYAGIGARATPDDMLAIMQDAACHLDKMDWLLRSGHARGADQAFENGSGLKEIHLPWPSYNGAYIGTASNGDIEYLVPKHTKELVAIAEKHHPAWHRLPTPVKSLMIRNASIILGTNCKEPADMVVCWTSGGKGEGGTGHGIRIARSYNIPVFDLAVEGAGDKLVAFVMSKQRVEA